MPAICTPVPERRTYQGDRDSIHLADKPSRKMTSPHKAHLNSAENTNGINTDPAMRSSMSNEGSRNLHSMTLSAASFVDLRMTRPPEGMRPKPDKAVRKKVAKTAKTEEEAADEAANSRRRMNALLRNFCDDPGCDIKTDIDLHKFSLDTGESVSNATVQELCIIQPNLTR